MQPVLPSGKRPCPGQNPLKMRKIIILLILCSVSPELYGQVNPGLQRNFIERLFKGGRYFECIGELRRIQNVENYRKVEYFIYSSYYMAGQYISVYDNYKPELSDPELKVPSLLLISQSYSRKGLLSESYDIFRGIKYSEIDSAFRFDFFYRKTEPLLLSGDLDRIEVDILEADQFLKDSPDYLKLRTDLESFRSEGLKKPVLAVFMSSLVPGAGQAYSGYYTQALLSFLSVSATGAGGIYMYRKGERDISYVLLFFCGLFYGGNIYGAYNSAVLHNTEIIDTWHKEVTGKYGEYSPAYYFGLNRVFN